MPVDPVPMDYILCSGITKKTQAAMKEHFDPFNDRKARDIRNSLSGALVAQLTRQAGDAVAETAASWLARVKQPVYRDYIQANRK